MSSMLYHKTEVDKNYHKHFLCSCFNRLCEVATINRQHFITESATATEIGGKKKKSTEKINLVIFFFFLTCGLNYYYTIHHIDLFH